MQVEGIIALILANKNHLQEIKMSILKDNSIEYCKGRLRSFGEIPLGTLKSVN